MHGLIFETSLRLVVVLTKEPTLAQRKQWTTSFVSTSLNYKSDLALFPSFLLSFLPLVASSLLLPMRWPSPCKFVITRTHGLSKRVRECPRTEYFWRSNNAERLIGPCPRAKIHFIAMYEVDPKKLSQLILPQVSNPALPMVMGKCGGRRLQTKYYQPLPCGFQHAGAAERQMSSRRFRGEATLRTSSTSW